MAPKELSPSMRERIDNRDARRGTFSSYKAEIVDTGSGDVTRADVSTLGSYLDGLRRVGDAAFHEGEHAR
jgi:hypothetical protein